jgi:hypothetical protein
MEEELDIAFDRCGVAADSVAVAGEKLVESALVGRVDTGGVPFVGVCGYNPQRDRLVAFGP